MLRSFVITILIVSSQTAWGVDPTAADIQAEVARLEETLRTERDLERTREAVKRRLIEVRDSRFAKNKDSIALGLVTLPTKAFPNPVTAQERFGEVKTQSNIIGVATRKFDELRTKDDSEEAAPPLGPSRIPVAVTNFATLKQSLDLYGDTVIETPGALGKLADEAREKAKIAQAAEKKKATAEEEEDPDDPHFRTGPEATPLAEATLNQFTADAFSRSARAAEDYLKFAALLLGPVVKKEQEVNRSRDLAAVEPTPPPGDVTPPQDPPSGSPPKGIGANPGGPKPKTDDDKKEKAQAKNSDDKKGDDKKGDDKKDDKSDPSSGGALGQTPKSKGNSTPLDAAKIAQPQPNADFAGTILTTSLGPREADFSVLSELTRAAINTAPPTPGGAFLGGKIESPNLNVPAGPGNTSPTARAPTSLPVSRPLIQGEWKPVQAVASTNSGAGSAEGSSPSTPPIRISGSPLTSGAGDGGLPRGGPTFPEEAAKIRRILGTTGSSFEIIDDDSPNVGTGGPVFAGFPNQILMPLGVDKPADRRGILSRVGTLCRSVDTGKVPACARTR